MHKVSKILFFLFFAATAFRADCQKKYAVLVGIDDYYDSPSEKSHSSLNGCVNDALAMRELLVNRFGFQRADIRSLHNKSATKKNFIYLMLSMQQLCKPGDELFFFYSGHGVWMRNPENFSDPVKRGKSQAIVMSDLYAPKWECLVRDETLKEIFNKFVDKKVIVTTVFDCCFSAHLMMMPRWDFLWENTELKRTKDLNIRYITYQAEGKKPTGCTGDPAVDTIDSDGDHIPDCADWEVNSAPLLYVDSLGVVAEPDPEIFWNLTDPSYDSISAEMESGGEKSFKIKQTITVRYRSTEARPSETRGSQFLSMAATTDYNLGLEITDISGTKHGAFTAALLTVYSRNNSNIPVSQLMRQIESIMKGQFYKQGPTYHFDSSRLSGPLAGIKTPAANTRLRVKCLSVKNGIIQLDGGLLAFILKENVLTNISLPGKPKIKVENATADNATARDITPGMTKPGHWFELTDNYTISKPHTRVYIPSVNISLAAYQAFFRQTILPKSKEKKYEDHFNYNEQNARTLIFYRDLKKTLEFQVTENRDPAEEVFSSVFLPPPAYIIDGLKKKLLKDQNIELVDDTSRAELMLFINYAKASEGKKAGFVFGFNTPKLLEKEFPVRVFRDFYAVTPTLELSGRALEKLYDDIQKALLELLRMKTTAWLNYHEKR